MAAQQQAAEQPAASPPKSAPKREDPAGSSGVPSPLEGAGFAPDPAATVAAAAEAVGPDTEPTLAAAAAVGADAAAAAGVAAAAAEAAAAAADEDEKEDWELPADAAPAEPLSLEEEEGLAALLAALKCWLRAPHALNDVPLSIPNPRVGAGCWPLGGVWCGRRKAALWLNKRSVLCFAT